MENASKALIIAGAILISILLIGVGVMVMNSADDTVASMETSMNEQEITTFNSKFTKYEGDRVSAANAKSLINVIATSNTANQITTDSQVNDVKAVSLTTVIGSQTTNHKIAGVSGARSKIVSTKTYKVECTTNATSGLVTSVKITQNT